ncbi:MAG TPA: phospholipase D-like domain-containing protein, partial [Thermogutta sp.]|nr:phospholipase D-like domain-containing protein [Thermogutta sp.]
MPQIFDNVTLKLIEGLEKAFDKAVAASFCIGYLNLRGWDQVAGLVETLQGGDEDHACRVLVGMYRPPDEEMRALASLRLEQEAIDGQVRARLISRIEQIFRDQLTVGVPSASVEQALRGLAAQLRARKVFVKAFLQYPLHAKLYLVQRDDPVAPLVGFVGSSNLTLAGLSRQGELNVDVVEQDAAKKLQAWFDERWGDELAVDLSDKLATLIETSWARSKLVRPYLVYLKIAYHLSEEAGEEESRFRAPQIFAEKGTPLLNFQEKAV